MQQNYDSGPYGSGPYSSGLETKFARFDAENLKVVPAQDYVEIEGYASVFGAVDQGGDVVASGAYQGSLARLKRENGRVKMLWQHDPAQPIGVWDEVHEDARGLWVKGRLLRDVARGREAAALLEAGAMDGLSIGYRTVKAAKTEKGQRLLTELELWEVSLVTFPMLPSARVGGKSAVSHEGTKVSQIRALTRAVQMACEDLQAARMGRDASRYQPKGRSHEH